MEQQQVPAATVRLRGGDGEDFEVDARRLAALFWTHVFSFPAIDSIAIFNLLVVYLKLQARGWHTAPLVERCFVRTIGDYGTLTRLASAARHLGMDDLLNVPPCYSCVAPAGKGCENPPKFADPGGVLGGTFSEIP